MSEKSNLPNEAADGLRTMFSRLAEFFHIFDLSFLVSGAATLGALLFVHHRLGFSAAFLSSGWVAGFALVIACYVCGLVSFSLGRTINRGLFRRHVLERHLGAAIQTQSLHGRIIDHRDSGAQHDGLSAGGLYARLWQQLADRHPKSVAYSHLSRYWAMAATYDGVAVSFLVWAIAVTPLPFLGTSFLSLGLALFVMVALVAASLVCFCQGAKYYEFQIGDLVAALAVMKSAVD